MEICEAASHPLGAEAFASILFAGRARQDFDEIMRRLGQSKVPVALCYGAEDPWVKPIWGQRAFRRSGESLPYYEVSPSGHCPHHETPKAVADVLVAWLNDLPTSEEILEKDGRTISIRKVDGQPRDLSESIAKSAWGYPNCTLERATLRREQ